jgi:hypothetical protein
MLAAYLVTIVLIVGLMRLLPGQSRSPRRSRP